MFQELKSVGIFDGIITLGFAIKVSTVTHAKFGCLDIASNKAFCAIHCIVCVYVLKKAWKLSETKCQIFVDVSERNVSSYLGC